jgi:hypothetical protein
VAYPGRLQEGVEGKSAYCAPLPPRLKGHAADKGQFRGITLLTSVIVLTPDLLAEGRTYVYVPIGEVKKVEFHNWVYASRETLTDHIKFLEAQALVLRLARIHPSTYTLPLSHIQWNVMLAINPEVKGRWEEAARRAITGSGNTVPVEPAIISGNVAYELFASEAAKAHKLATTPAGWCSATGTDRNHQPGRLYTLARPIHSIHSKSLGVRASTHTSTALSPDVFLGLIDLLRPLLTSQ